MFHFIVLKDLRLGQLALRPAQLAVQTQTACHGRPSARSRSIIPFGNQNHAITTNSSYMTQINFMLPTALPYISVSVASYLHRSSQAACLLLHNHLGVGIHSADQQIVHCHQPQPAARTQPPRFDQLREAGRQSSSKVCGLHRKTSGNQHASEQRQNLSEERYRTHQMEGDGRE